MRKIFYWDQELTASDSFCGGGGEGKGLEDAGISVEVAINHNENSIATYQRNFPNAKTYCVNIENVDFQTTPHTLVGAGAPECTYHSPSAGETLANQAQLAFEGWTDRDDKPHVEQSRMSMWQVYRAAEAKKAVGFPFHSQMYENVPEVAIYWRDYREWVKKMKDLGYEFQALFLNAMFFGVPQRRDRWIGVLWRKEAKKPMLVFRPLAMCHSCEREVNALQSWKKPQKKAGEYSYHSKIGQYTYNCPRCAQQVFPFFTPAAAVVDFVDKGIRLKDRKQHGLKPLDAKTMQRLQRGIDLYVKKQQTPPLGARVPTNLPQGPLPFWITFYSNGKPYSIFEPFCTFSTKARCGIAFPPASGSLDLNEFSFRMLNEKEIMAATGIQNGKRVPDEATPRNEQHFEIVASSQEELIRQCGHMVPPPMSAWVARRLVEAM